MGRTKPSTMPMWNKKSPAGIYTQMEENNKVKITATPEAWEYIRVLFQKEIEQAKEEGRKEKEKEMKEKIKNKIRKLLRN